jgi:hypothetical protein
MNSTIEKKLIDKLSSLPVSAFKKGKPRHCGSLSGSVSGGDSDQSSFQYYDSSRKQLFSIIENHWIRWYQDMAGETEMEQGISHYLKTYNGKTDKGECIFETSGDDVEKLYKTIENKIERVEIKEEQRKKETYLKNLKKFAEG